MSPPEAPSWTEGNQGDPGITILELLAYVIAGATAGAIAYAWLCARRAPSDR